MLLEIAQICSAVGICLLLIAGIVQALFEPMSEAEMKSLGFTEKQIDDYFNELKKGEFKDYEI